MISKLPRWVWTGAWILAFMAGIVNVVGLLGFEHQVVTHLTGTSSMLAAAAAALDGPAMFRFAAIIASFMAGAALSGFLIQHSTLQLGRRYGVALILESLLLGLAVPLLQRHNLAGIYFCSGACGLQNAMMTTYSGAVVRTTHLSGMFTDLGISLGHALRGIPVDSLRLRLCLLIISAFLSGGVAGAFAFRYLSYSTLFIPSGLAATISIGYGLYQIRARRESNHAIS
ncbi:MAG TPA: YoaK family protein [Candidatus Saccharimonadales bacterium]|nr:YoaK family protein [Candidatus Saccharimonadales bacterium]